MASKMLNFSGSSWVSLVGTWLAMSVATTVRDADMASHGPTRHSCLDLLFDGAQRRAATL